MSSLELNPPLTPPRGMHDFILSRIDYERVTIPKEAEYFKLARMRELLELLGNPQDRLSILHIAGTKGKGSTAAMAAAMLRESGKRTGLYTSPHLHRVEERIVADGKPISAEAFERIVETIRPAVERLDAKDAASDLPIGGPTFFEIVNAAALLWFVEQKVDAAVMEVGLGGRLDSTNICSPKVTVITSIGLDHTKQLGSTLAQIAIEKAGIIKPGVPCVTGVVTDEPLQEIRRIAAEQGAPLYEVGRDFRYEYSPPPAPSPQSPAPAPFRTGTVDYIDFFGDPTGVRGYTMRDMQLPMLGAHQAANAATAIAAVRLFCAETFPVSPRAISSNAIRGGVAKGRLGARMQLISKTPAIMVDAAHNEPSVRAMLAALKETSPQFRRRIALISISRDKAVDEMLAALVPYFDSIICTRFTGNPRACAAGDLAERARRIAETLALSHAPEIAAFEQPESAWEAVRSTLQESDFLCIAGSFFIAGEMLELIEQFPPLQLNSRL